MNINELNTLAANINAYLDAEVKADEWLEYAQASLDDDLEDEDGNLLPPAVCFQIKTYRAWERGCRDIAALEQRVYGRSNDIAEEIERHFGLKVKETNGGADLLWCYEVLATDVDWAAIDAARREAYEARCAADAAKAAANEAKLRAEVALPCTDADREKAAKFATLKGKLRHRFYQRHRGALIRAGVKPNPFA